ncbi:MAG: glycosyltransferase family 39 protein [Chloroflexota bacterium]
MSTTTSSPNALLTVRGLRVARASKADLRNLLLIGVGFLAVLLTIPPTRTYPMNDDWIYSQSVSELTQLAYKPHDWTQPIAIGHLGWGAIFAALFGNTFTVLTIANMVMSLACLITFYLLLRQLQVASGPALFGVALLGFNPIYVYISYSFMTDVTFLFYILAACLLFIRGLEGLGEAYLWLGGLATALAYLTRQYGILVVVAALAFLWLSRTWTWWRALSMLALPALAVVGYAVWEHFQPQTLITVQMNLVQQDMFSNLSGYFDSRMLRVAWLAQSLGLCLAPLLILPRRIIWAIPLFAVIVYYQFQSLRIAGSLFPENGNVIDSTGLLLYNYDANQVWNQAVWALLGIVGALIFAVFLLSWIKDIAAYLKIRPWQRKQSPGIAFVPYALAIMLAGVILLATPFLFDRYWLAILPLLMIAPLRKFSLPATGMHQGSQMTVSEPTPLDIPGPSPASRRLRWAGLAAIALFSLLAIRDYKEHATTRWQAAQSLIERGAPASEVRAGYEVDGWYNFRSGAQYIRQTGDMTHINYPPDAVINATYIVNDLPVKGYIQIGALTYRSWLDGGAAKQVLILQRQ